MMISWQTRVEGQAGDAGEAVVGPSTGFITGARLVAADAAGDVAPWKTKQLLPMIPFYFPPYQCDFF